MKILIPSPTGERERGREAEEKERARQRERGGERCDLLAREPGRAAGPGRLVPCHPQLGSDWIALVGNAEDRCLPRASPPRVRLERC